MTATAENNMNTTPPVPPSDTSFSFGLWSFTLYSFDLSSALFIVMGISVALSTFIYLFRRHINRLWLNSRVQTISSQFRLTITGLSNFYNSSPCKRLMEHVRMVLSRNETDGSTFTSTERTNFNRQHGPEDNLPPMPPIETIPELDSNLQNEACIICFDDLSQMDVAAPPCGHAMHEKCLLRWLQHDRARACPICRVGWTVESQ